MQPNLPLAFGSKHLHSVQYIFCTFGPQQSPPSYLQAAVLAQSSQNLSPTTEAATHLVGIVVGCGFAGGDFGVGAGAGGFGLAGVGAGAGGFGLSAPEQASDLRAKKIDIHIRQFDFVTREGE